jgi:hypothetical protein
MRLVGKRFDIPIDYAEYFGPSNPDKIWKVLYAYRSCLAHGSEPDFAKELKILGDARKVAAFMRMAVRRLLRYAIQNTELVLDLKEC